MIRILFFIPYPQMKDKLEMVLNSLPERDKIELTVRQTAVDQTPVIDENLFDIVIARGHTAAWIRQNQPQLPLVELSVSGYDIVQAMACCKEQLHPQRVAVCGYDGELYEVSEIAKIFSFDVKVYQSERYTQIPALLRRIRQDGCDAVIGGYFTHLLAEKEGIPSFVIRAGEDNIQRALREAVSTVKLLQSERLRTALYKSVLDSSREGILYVDAQGIIQVRNRAAQTMLMEPSLRKASLFDVLPFLGKSFRQVLKEGSVIENELHPLPRLQIKLACTLTPVKPHGRTAGAVIHFSDVTAIQEQEGQIRQKLSGKGLLARYTFEDIIHQTPQMEETIRVARRYAFSTSNIILSGETGSGKELFAQSIHNASPRHGGPFVAVNCAALAENLLESELFGYAPGAFTGGSKNGKMGLFEQAHRGTLFLDEISEISLSMQTKLLRVLQEHQVRRIGDDKVIEVDVRIICATNQNLKKMVQEGRFRKDLLYRLDVLRVALPPLRQRREDIPLLFCHMLEELALRQGERVPQVEEEAYQVLEGYPFEGNVRELNNLAERAFVLHEGNVITRQDMCLALGKSEEQPSGKGMEEESELFVLRRVLQETGGHRGQAAALLGCDRSTLWRKMQKYPEFQKNK